MRALLLSLFAVAFSTHAAYFRHPAINGDTLVFVAEGDLWRVSAANGGEAQRITSHPGSESAPA